MNMNINPMDFIKNIKNLQTRVTEMQEKMKDLTVTGTAGGDMVRIEINGHMEVKKVEIAKEVVDPNDVVMLQDLVLAAFTDALVKIKEKIREETSQLTGGLNVPPGFMGL